MGWALACSLALVPLLDACTEVPPPDTRFTAVPGGDADRGRALMVQYQCAACHAIPGVAGPAGSLGPPLHAFGRRSYIAGHVPNTPQALQQWLQSPPALVPGTAMPDLGVTPADARHMAAYLLALR